MARLFADATGVLLRLARNTVEESGPFGQPPPNTTYTLAFDETTNPGIVAGLSTNWNSYSMPGGVLTQNGQAVAIAAPSQQFSDRQAIAAILTALANGTATQAQTGQAVRFLIRVLNQNGLI